MEYNICFFFKAIPSTQDFVLSASPADPPLIICTLQHIMKQKKYPHSTVSHVHSSVQEPIPEFVKTHFWNFTSSTEEIGRASVILTIVWKKGWYLYLFIGGT